MNWPHGPTVALALFSESDGKVQWSGSIPSELPSGLIESCIRNIRVSRSISQALLEHWDPEFDELDDVERVECDDNAVLTACKVPGVSDLRLGSFTRSVPCCFRLNLNALPPALIRAASFISGLEHVGNSELKDSSEFMEVFSGFVESIFQKYQVVSRNSKYYDHVLQALECLSALYSTPSTRAFENSSGAGLSNGSSLQHNHEPEQSEGRITDGTGCFKYCVIRKRDCQVSYSSKMSVQASNSHSWYYKYFISSRLVGELVEKKNSGMTRAWFASKLYVICFHISHRRDQWVEEVFEDSIAQLRSQTSHIFSLVQFHQAHTH